MAKRTVISARSRSLFCSLLYSSCVMFLASYACSTAGLSVCASFHSFVGTTHRFASFVPSADTIGVAPADDIGVVTPCATNSPFSIVKSRVVSLRNFTDAVVFRRDWGCLAGLCASKANGDCLAIATRKREPPLHISTKCDLLG